MPLMPKVGPISQQLQDPNAPNPIYSKNNVFSTIGAFPFDVNHCQLKEKIVLGTYQVSPT